VAIFVASFSLWLPKTPADFKINKIRRGCVTLGEILPRRSFCGQQGMRNKQISTAPFIPRLSEVGNERQGFFETADFDAVFAKLPEYLRDLARFGFVTGWRKGSIE